MTIAEVFTDRSLPRAVQVLEVGAAGARRGQGREDERRSCSAPRTRSSTRRSSWHRRSRRPTCRCWRLLNFYPALTPEGLLRLLDNEPDRAKRRLWLALLEAHGLPARQHALDRLEASFADAGNAAHVAWLQRNFVYLLHRIRPAEGDDPLREVRLVARCTEMGLPAPLVREGLIDLGLRHHAEAEAVLRARLEQIEKLLEQPGGAPHDAPELLRMLALVVSGLARQGTTSARRTVVEHGLKQRPALGDTLERLGEWAATTSPPTRRRSTGCSASCARNCRCASSACPSAATSSGRTTSCAPSASTRCEPVRAAFEDVARRFPAARSHPVAHAERTRRSA